MNRNRKWISTLLILVAALSTGCAIPSEASPVTETTTPVVPTPTVIPTRTPTRMATVAPSPTLLTATVKLDAQFDAGIFGVPIEDYEQYRGKIPRGQTAVVLGRSEVKDARSLVTPQPPQTRWLYVEYEGIRGFAYFPLFEWPYSEEAYVALPMFDPTTGLPVPSPTPEKTPTTTSTPTLTRAQTTFERSTPVTTTLTSPTNPPTSTPTLTATATQVIPFTVLIYPDLNLRFAEPHKVRILLRVTNAISNPYPLIYVFTVNDQEVCRIPNSQNDTETCVYTFGVGEKNALAWGYVEDTHGHRVKPYDDDPKHLRIIPSK